MGTEDTHTQVVRALDHRESHGRVVQCEAVTAGSPCRVGLERRDPTTRDLRVHDVEGCPDRCEVRREHALGQHPTDPAVRELPREVGGAHRVRVGHRRVVRARVGNVGEHGDGRVAREEEIVDVVRTVEALELVGRVTRLGDEIPDHVDGRRRGGSPRPRGHHVVGVHVDDELSAGRQHRLARRHVGRGGRLEVPARLRGRRRPRRTCGCVGRTGVEHRQAERDPGGRLEELAPAASLAAGDRIRSVEDLADDRPVAACRRPGQELAVPDLARQQRQRWVGPIEVSAAAG